eukprot:s4270_g2.t1
MYVERSRSRDDPPDSPHGHRDSRWPTHHRTQLPFPPSSSTSSEAPAWRDVVIIADFSEVSLLADENWNFLATHPLNHVLLPMVEEKALWQYTRFVYANQVDTYTLDQLLSGIAERIEEQWQISVSPDDLEIRYDENHGLEVFQVTSDQPFWNLRNLLDQYRPQWQTHQFSASEKTRIVSLGGEIRSKIHEDGFEEQRIFVEGQDMRDVPGLCMTRTLGDEAVKDHGVIATPEVVKTQVDLQQKVFLLVASDGVWEFLDSQCVVNTLANCIEDGPAKLAKLQLEAKNQWKKRHSGGYCDDITSVLVPLR